jgi:hypothetical protein
MSVQQRRKYDPEFKKNAVLLAEEPSPQLLMLQRILASKLIFCIGGDDNSETMEK